MNLDKMKNQTKTIKAPDLKFEGGAGAGHPLEDLIEELKVQDMRDSKRLRRAMVFYGIAAVLYLLIFTLTWIFPPDTSPGLHRAILGIFAFAFLSIGIFGGVKSRELSGMNYAAPVLEFLDKSEQRCKFLRLKDLLYGLPYLILLGVTGGFAVKNGMDRYLPSLDPAVGVGAYVLLCLISAVVGLIFSRLEWKKRKAPLLAKIRQMKAELG